MNKYLLAILQDSNTIIIPGLGALTITNKEKNEIMFMSYLKHDDGKLSSYISDKDGVDETEAKNIVAKFVREIQASLDKGESYDMFQFGTFSKEDGEIEFKAWKSSSTTVESATSVVPPAKNSEPKKETPIEKKEVPSPIKEPQEKTVEPVKFVVDSVQVTPPPIVKKEDTPAAPTEIVNKEISRQQPVPPIKPMNIIEKEELSKNVEKLDTLKGKTSKEKSIKKAVVAPIVTASNTLENKTETLREDTKNEIKEIVGKKKKKRGKGFWFDAALLILLVAFGTYFFLNYNTLKQHIPFLADKVEKKAPVVSELDKMKDLLGDEETESLQESSLENSDEEIAASDEKLENDSEELTDASEDLAEEGVYNEPIEETIENTVTVEPTPSPQITESSVGAYKVIAGVFSSEQNAQRQVKKFQEQGLPASTFVNAKGMHVVCMKTFNSSSSANAEIKDLQAISSDAWIMYRP